MLKTNFSGHNKVWGTQKIWGDTAPECNPVATGPVVRELYPQLSKLAFRILLPLPQYLCERGFSILAHIKPETRNQSKVEHEIRLALSNTQPRISNTQPRISNTQPRISNTQPRIPNTQPRISNTQPRISNTQPRISNTQPRISNTQPRISNTQPCQTLNHEFQTLNHVKHSTTNFEVGHKVEKSTVALKIFAKFNCR